MSPSLRALLKPDPDLLLSMLSEVVDDAMLKDIAEIDYGWHAEENFEKLLAIRCNGIMSAPMDYPLREIFHLSRWSAPDSYGWKPGNTSHIQRAFCCAALVKAGGSEENRDFFEGENTNVGKLIASLDALGPAYQQVAIGLFAWRLGTSHDSEDPPFFWLAILRYALIIWPGLEASYIIEMVELLLQAEASARTDPATVINSETEQQWLFALTHFNGAEDVWRSFVADLRNAATVIQHEQARAKVLHIASLLDSEPEQSYHAEHPA